MFDTERARCSRMDMMATDLDLQPAIAARRAASAASLVFGFHRARPIARVSISLKSENQRSCGSCTACCDGWLQIEVRGHRIAPGTPCPFSVEHQCSIYNERPQHPCREFICGWLAASSPLPEWMRPDKADMILLPANFLWRGLPVDVALPVGQPPKKKALHSLTRFSPAKKQLLIYRIE